MEHVSQIAWRVMDKLALRNIEIMINRESRAKPEDRIKAALKIGRYVLLLSDDNEKRGEYLDEAARLMSKYWGDNHGISVNEKS